MYRETSFHICPVFDEALALGPHMRVIGVHAVCAQICRFHQPVRRQNAHWKVNLLACPELPIKVVAGLVVIPEQQTLSQTPVFFDKEA